MTTPLQCEPRGLAGPLMMIVAGTILLIGQFMPELGFQRLWPLLLIAGGLAALYGRR